jgi:hypothetical protein
MTNKDKTITKFVQIIKNTFGENAFEETDYWDEDLLAIGLKRLNKLIYISTAGCKKNQCYYELELLVDDPEIIYISKGSDDGNKQKLLEVISDFFEIKPIHTS